MNYQFIILDILHVFRCRKSSTLLCPSKFIIYRSVQRNNTIEYCKRFCRYAQTFYIQFLTAIIHYANPYFAYVKTKFQRCEITSFFFKIYFKHFKVADESADYFAD